MRPLFKAELVASTDIRCEWQPLVPSLLPRVRVLLELSTALVDLRCSSSSSPGAGSQGRAGVSTTPFPLPPPLWTRSPSQKLRDSAPIGTSPSPPSLSQPPDCRAYGPASFRPFPLRPFNQLPSDRVYLLMTSETPKLPESQGRPKHPLCRVRLSLSLPC